LHKALVLKRLAPDGDAAPQQRSAIAWKPALLTLLNCWLSLDRQTPSKDGKRKRFDSGWLSSKTIC